MSDEYRNTNPIRGRRRFTPYAYGWMATFAILLIYVAGGNLVTFLFADSVSASGGVEIGPGRMMWAAIVGQILFLLLPALSFARSHPLGIRTVLRLRKPKPVMYGYAALGVMAGVALTTAWLVAQELYLVPDGWLDAYHQLQQQTEWIQNLLYVGADVPLLLLGMLGIAIVPGVCEEFVFRGIAQRSFEERLKPFASMSVAAAVFAMVHLQPTNFIPLFGLGLFLGLLAWASQSVWPSVLAHFMHNALQLLLLNLVASPLTEPSSELTTSDFVSILPVALLSMFGVVLIARGMLRHRRMERVETPQPVDSSGRDNEPTGRWYGDG